MQVCSYTQNQAIATIELRIVTFIHSMNCRNLDRKPTAFGSSTRHLRFIGRIRSVPCLSPVRRREQRCLSRCHRQQCTYTTVDAASHSCMVVPAVVCENLHQTPSNARVSGNHAPTFFLLNTVADDNQMRSTRSIYFVSDHCAGALE